MSDDLRYRGYRIVSDVREVLGTRTWLGKVAGVQPADESGIERVHGIFAGQIDRNLATARRL